MATIAALNAVFGMKTSGFEKGAKKISKKTKQMADEMNKSRRFMKGDFFGVASMKQAGVAIAAMTAGLVTYAMKIGIAADATAKFARRLGMSFEEMQKLEHIAKLTGTSGLVMQRGLRNMVRGVSEAAAGFGVAKKELDALNLSAEDLRNMSADKQFREIAKAMASVKNESDKVRIAFNIFGGKGVDLINTLKEVEEQMDRINSSDALSAGILSEDQARQFEVLNDDIADLGLMMKGLMVDNGRFISDTLSNAAKIAKILASTAGFYIGTWKKAVQLGADLITMSAKEREMVRKSDKQQIENLEIQARYKARLNKNRIKAEERLTAELKNQEEIRKRQLPFVKAANALIEGDMTEKERAIRDFNELLKLQEVSGAYGPRAQKAIDIASKKIDEIVKKEGDAADARIDAIKEERKERREEIAETIRSRNKAFIDEIKSRKALLFDSAIAKREAEIDAIKENKISEARVGFSRAISKGISSKGLADSAKQINKKQLDAQEKQLKVAEDTLVVLKQKRQLVAG